MKEMLELKRKAKELGLCSSYSDAWDKCETKEDLIRLATDSNGASFLCDGATFGWGVPPEFIADKFKDYVNGNYKVEHNGYTSELYVNYKGTITAGSTVMILIGCKGKVYIPKFHVCKAYVALGDVEIICEGCCEIVAYQCAERDNVSRMKLSGNVKIESVETSEWRK